ncbi:MAG: hypothetical protein ACI9DF_005668 [Verrucomicrobiales bacterium]|jgi:hypothetical protein
METDNEQQFTVVEQLLANGVKENNSSLATSSESDLHQRLYWHALRFVIRKELEFEAH